jgi:hypothetical protein
VNWHQVLGLSHRQLKKNIKPAPDTIFKQLSSNSFGREPV